MCFILYANNVTRTQALTILLAYGQHVKSWQYGGICDVIKLNQSFVRNIDFEIKPIIPLYLIVLSNNKMVLSLEREVQLRWGFHQNQALKVAQLMKCRTEN